MLKRRHRCCSVSKVETYHLVHGIVGVIVLSVGAADPGRFQEIVFISLIVPLLRILLPLAVLFPLSISLSVTEGLLAISAPGGRGAAVSARARRAL